MGGNWGANVHRVFIFLSTHRISMSNVHFRSTIDVELDELLGELLDPWILHLDVDQTVQEHQGYRLQPSRKSARMQYVRFFSFWSCMWPKNEVKTENIKSVVAPSLSNLSIHGMRMVWFLRLPLRGAVRRGNKSPGSDRIIICFSTLLPFWGRVRTFWPINSIIPVREWTLEWNNSFT